MVLNPYIGAKFTDRFMLKDEAIKTKESLMRKFTWSKLNHILNFMGWYAVRDTDNQKIYERGRQKIAILRFPRNKWKVEVLVNNRVVDTGGFEPEDFAKVLAFELALSRSV